MFAHSWPPLVPEILTQLSKNCHLTLPEKRILQLGKLRSREGQGTAGVTQPQSSSNTAWPVFDLYWDVRWGGGPALVPTPCW